MAENVLLPLDDETDDLVLRLTHAEAVALHKLLGELSHNEKLAKGLSSEQASLVSNVFYACY
jgi:hypothetical protein